MNWNQASQQLQACSDRPSVEQVKFRVQLQHRSTWRRDRPVYLPVECILECPVGVLNLLFLPPNGLAAVLDDDALPSIVRTSRVLLENGYRNLHRESTPVASTHVPLPSTPSHYRSRGCVCVCVTYIYPTLNIFHTISLYNYLHLPLPLRYTSYTPTLMSHLKNSDYFTTPCPYPLPLIFPSIPSVSPRFNHTRALAVTSPPHPSAQVAAGCAPLYREVCGGSACCTSLLLVTSSPAQSHIFWSIPASAYS